MLDDMKGYFGSHFGVLGESLKSYFYKRKEKISIFSRRLCMPLEYNVYSPQRQYLMNIPVPTYGCFSDSENEASHVWSESLLFVVRAM